MDANITASIRAVWTKVHSPTGVPFPQVVAELSALGVTRYRVDYVGRSVTAYLGSGEVDVAALEVDSPAPSFSKAVWDSGSLLAAIRSAQAGTIGSYHDFSRAAVAAGVTDYTAYLAGRKVMYCGALGESHVERFPGSKTD